MKSCFLIKKEYLDGIGDDGRSFFYFFFADVI